MFLTTWSHMRRWTRYQIETTHELSMEKITVVQKSKPLWEEDLRNWSTDWTIFLQPVTLLLIHLPLTGEKSNRDSYTQMNGAKTNLCCIVLSQLYTKNNNIIPQIQILAQRDAKPSGLRPQYHNIDNFWSTCKL